MTSSIASPGRLLNERVEDATTWATKEKQEGTLLAEETLWREAYLHYLAALPAASDGDRGVLWPTVALGVVFDSLKLPLDYSSAAAEAVGLLKNNADLSFLDKARKLDEIADGHNLERWKLRTLLAPGLGYPWMFPRSLWTPELFSRELYSMLASAAWTRGQEPDAESLLEEGIRNPLDEFLMRLRDRTPEGSDLARMLAAGASLTRRLDSEGKDILVLEPHAFIAELEHEGLSHSDIARLWRQLLDLRDAVVLVRSFHLYHRAESCYLASKRARETDPEQALGLLARAANMYKRLSVAHMYPEPLLERHQEIYREMEELRGEHALQDHRYDQVLLITTYNSPFDLQRLMISVAHELMGFGFGKRVHVIVSDDSGEEMRRQNEQILAQASRAGLSISHWTPDGKKEFLDELNREHFSDASFDVWDLAGCLRKPGEKGPPTAASAISCGSLP
ncbi:MAG: hypothetical protein M3198_15190 [Actinomycetota bacterium]|nr:hypothetical protein [Actinomycetota bacterium]